MNTRNTALINSVVQQAWASESPVAFMFDLLESIFGGAETRDDKFAVMMLLEGLGGRFANQLGEDSLGQQLAAMEKQLKSAKRAGKKAQKRSARAAGERFRKLRLIDETGGAAKFKKFWTEEPERLVGEFLAGFEDDSPALTADLRCAAADHLRRAADQAVMYWGDREIHGAVEV
ncbi:hypothetical protein GCM10017576_23340 [Microbacterium barkeri]|uniref:Uncharacterized protein n=2 Tax=Microbacterium barkeri TaxID=33917 RepID=A0A9W6H4X4_9MICO|nr:hypothetical protein [Microbacterium barkeri]GLJ62204.1 hypothetical protein GCM10017576_23340 [Microbacterium barkeri]